MLAEWQLWADDSNVLAPETCQQIIDLMTGLPPQGAAVGFSGSVDETLRRSQIRWISREMLPDLHDFVRARMEEANRNAFGLDLSYLPDLQFTSYQGSRLGWYGWHQDLFV